MNYATLLNNPVVVKQLQKKVAKPVVTGAIDERVAAPLLANICEDDGLKKPFAGQLYYGILPTVTAWLPKELGGLNRKSFLLNAEMGAGKTIMSMVSAYQFVRMTGRLEKGAKVIVMTDGSKLLPQMAQEASEIYPKEILDIYFIRNSTNLKKSEISLIDAAKMKAEPGRLAFFVMSKDTGKSELKWDVMKSNQRCPSCGSKMNDETSKKDKVVPVPFCPNCGLPTKFVIRGKITKLSLAQELKRLDKNSDDSTFFDVFLMDEAHKMQDPESLQSKTYRALVKHSYRVLLMTGTLSNGYASSIFHILYPAFPNEFKKLGFGYSNIAQFIEYFGATMDSRTTNGSRSSKKLVELPEINYRIFSIITTLGVTVTNEDLDLPMPGFSERQVIVEPEPEITTTISFVKDRVKEIAKGFEKVYKSWGTNLWNYSLNNLQKTYEYKIIGKVRQYNNPLNQEDYTLVPHEEVVSFNFEVTDAYISRKEQKLIDIVNAEKKEERRTLVFIDYAEANNVAERLEKVLNDNGVTASALPSNVKSEDIMAWINSLESDVAILPQRRSDTGLNLVMFHTVVFYELSDQIRTVQQAKCRPWRPIGQTKDVRVFYLAYSGNQSSQLAMIGKKMVSTTVSSGKKILEDGLADLYDYQREQTNNIRAAEEIVISLKQEELGDRLNAKTAVEEAVIAFLQKIKPEMFRGKTMEEAIDEELKHLKDSNTTFGGLTADEMEKVIKSGNLFAFDEEFMASAVDFKKVRRTSGIRRVHKKTVQKTLF